MIGMRYACLCNGGAFMLTGTHTNMTNHFWLVWYRAQSPLGPKHWSLYVTYDTEEEALGTIYQVSSILCLLARRWIWY